MSKLLFSFLFTALINVASFAQSRYVFIKFKDAQRPSVVHEFSFPEKTVAKAIDDKMEKLGYKGKESKGFVVYKGVTLSELGNQPLDMYFKVDGKRENTTVNLMMSKGNENFVTELDDASTINNAKSFMDSLALGIEAYDLEQQIANQENDLKKAEKKYQNLVNDADDLQKAKRKIENNIEENLKDQKNQEAEIEKQRQISETLKSKRKV
ncbi:MAG: hypothetical protein H0V14_06595 [Chitinophagaceae bacterium]|jgi:hypothetical protein|nr:hypothetical protein [Chitinophagaceae bacterium]